MMANEVEPIDEQFPSDGEQLPTNPNETETDVIDDIDTDVPDPSQDDPAPAGADTTIVAIDPEVADADDELPTNPSEPETDIIDETPDTSGEDVPEENLLSNQLTLPCIASVKAGDTVMVAMRNGVPTVIGGAGWGDGIEARVETAETLAAEAEAIASAIGQFAWNDASGTHVSTEEAVAAGTRNILLNSYGILLRAAANYLAALSQSGIAFYDGNGNAAANILASFGSGGAQIGSTSQTHLDIDSDSVDVVDPDEGTILSMGWDTDYDYAKVASSKNISLNHKNSADGWAEMGVSSEASQGAPEHKTAFASVSSGSGSTAHGASLELNAWSAGSSITMLAESTNVTRGLDIGGSVTYGGSAPMKDASDTVGQSLESSTWKALKSLTLTAGVWVIVAAVQYSGSSSVGYRRMNISPTSASTTISAAAGLSVPALNGGQTTISRSWIVNLNGSTTYYLNAAQSSGSAITAYCYFRAVRVA